MTTPSEVPPVPSARASGIWRMVLIVVSVQLVLIAAASVFFTAMGYANAGVGGCGGG